MEGGIHIILEEFDESKTAVINPWDIVKPVDEIPEVLVGCYAHTTFERMVDLLGAVKIAESSSANGIRKRTKLP